MWIPSQLDQTHITFIVCCPRSGSTWLRFLLNSHPEIACENETFLFTSSAGIGNVFKAYNFELGFKGLHKYLSEDQLIKFTSDYILNIFNCFLQKKKKTHIVEKSVDHALCIPLIKKIFPQSKFVYLTRDARDNAISLVHASSWKSELPNSIKDALQFWKYYNSEILKELDELTMDKYVAIKYENLLLNTEAEINMLFKFIGVKALPQEELTQIATNNSFSNLKAKYENWRDGNFFRIGKMNQWQDYFTDEDTKNSQEITGALLKKLGYTCK